MKVKHLDELERALPKEQNRLGTEDHCQELLQSFLQLHPTKAPKWGQAPKALIGGYSEGFGSALGLPPLLMVTMIKAHLVRLFQ